MYSIRRWRKKFLKIHVPERKFSPFNIPTSLFTLSEKIPVERQFILIFMVSRPPPPHSWWILFTNKIKKQEWNSVSLCSFWAASCEELEGMVSNKGRQLYRLEVGRCCGRNKDIHNYQNSRFGLRGVHKSHPSKWKCRRKLEENLNWMVTSERNLMLRGR